MRNNSATDNLQSVRSAILYILRWTVIAFVAGLLLGVLGALFYHCIAWGTEYRLTHPWVLFLLPVGAAGITFLYQRVNRGPDGGTNLVLTASKGDGNIPARMAPLIFVATVVSHFIGASVGREGAALQFGGSVGSSVGKLLRLDETDRRVMVMVGMSGLFSALFGTPIAAAVFSLEVSSVGIMNYGALMPCVVSALVARTVAARLGAGVEFFDIGEIPTFTAMGGLQIAILAVLAGFVAILFCVCLHKGGALAKRFLPNPYLRAVILGAAILGLTLLVGDQTYNGAGVPYIELCMEGEGRPESFLMKILFTVLSLTAGYKGGEIVPSFFIGASFGCTYGNLTGFAPPLCAAVGLGAVFCGVTNCPVTAFLICCELFGFAAAPYFLLALAFSYLVSGYFSLYSSQIIVYSKYKANLVNRETQ